MRFVTLSAPAVLLLATSAVYGQNILGQYSVPHSESHSLLYFENAQFATPDGTGGLFLYNSQDSSLHRFDSTGKELWNTPFSFGSFNGVISSMAVASDGVYIAGQVNGALPGQINAGGFDGVAVKYDLNGKMLWMRQFGTASGDFVRAIALNPNGVYVLGATSGPTAVASFFIQSFDSGGNQLWSRQFHDPILSDVLGAAADSTGIYFFGYTGPANYNVIRKFDSSGNDVWTKQLDQSDIILGIAPDNQGAYVLFFPGEPVLAIRRLDLTGSEVWTRQFLSSGISGSIAADSAGFYLSDVANSALPGQCYAGGGDMFLMRFDAYGNPVWTREWGTAGFERPAEIAIGAASVDVTGFGPTGAAFLATIEKSSAPASGTQPNILWECVLNAANYLGGAIAPGEIVTIFGSAMGPSELAQLPLTGDGQIPTTLGGAQIFFDGEPAPLIYAYATQSSAIVPFDIAGKSTVNVQVAYNGIQSAPVKMPVLTSRPGVFSFGPGGSGQAAIVNEDGTVNSPFNPATPGSTVSIYATGSGLTDPPGVDDHITGNAPSTFKASPYVRLTSDGSCDAPYFAADVVYYGGAPKSVPGLVQINVQLPMDGPVGDAVPIYFGLDPAIEQTVTIAIR